MITAKEARESMNNSKNVAEKKMKKVLEDNRNDFLRLMEKKIQENMNNGIDTIFITDINLFDFYTSVTFVDFNSRAENAAFISESTIFYKTELKKLGYKLKINNQSFNFMTISW